MKSKPHICGGVRAALVLVTFLMPLVASQAATFTVTNLDSEGTGSLRQAILDANADASATPENPHLVDASGVVGTIDLLEALPPLSMHVIIQGPDTSNLTVARSVPGLFRIFVVGTGVSAEITGLIITQGRDGMGPGGGIFNAGTLTIHKTIVTGCSALGGGGIYNSGELTVDHSLIWFNETISSSDQGGGLWNTGVATILSSSVEENLAHVGGAGIANSGTLTLLDSALVGNVAANPDLDDLDGGGGGLSNSGTAIIVNSAIDGNESESHGGGITNTGELTIMSGSEVSDNEATGGNGGGIVNRAGSILTIKNSTVNGNEAATLSVGGIGNWGELILTDSTVSGNATPLYGGGIVASGAGSTVSIERGAIRDNKADFAAGGIMINGSTVTLTASTVSGNQAGAGDGGAGIFMGISGGNLYLRNSTVSGNVSAGNAGGLRLSGTNLRIENSTIAANHAVGQGANLMVSASDVTVKSTILANPLGGGENCVAAFDGTITSQGYNLADDSSCDFNAPADQPVANALLAPLGNNGGPTETHALGEGSPAIDRGIAGEWIVDQRGYARIFDFPEVPNAPGGDGTDIGAFELQPIPNHIFLDRFEE